MKIDSTLLSKLEKLSSLKVDESKVDDTIKQLNEIVEFVENLNELNLDNEEPTFTILEGGTPMREDNPSVNPEVVREILRNAPKVQDESFVVPKIIE